MFISTAQEKRKHFQYNPNAFGGTEYMGRGFEQKILPFMPKLDNYLCVIAPGVTPSYQKMFDSELPIIFWLHNTSYQFGPEEKAFLSDSKFINNLKYLIVISEFQKQEVIKDVGIPADKIYVLPNAITPLNYNPEKFNNIKQVRLIHTSSPDRGFDVLMNSLKYVDEDFRLEIYNSFNPDQYPFEEFEPRARFYGFTPRNTVREAYENAHIHTYPSTYPETFCISQVEAMSAGLLCLTSDIGALPEVSKDLTQMYSYIEDREKHTKVFAEELTQAIQKIKSGSFDPKAQIEYVNNTYSWEAIKQKWIEFHDLI